MACRPCYHGRSSQKVSRNSGSPAAFCHFLMDAASHVTTKKCQRTRMAGDRICLLQSGFFDTFWWSHSFSHLLTSWKTWGLPASEVWNTSKSACGASFLASIIMIMSTALAGDNVPSSNILFDNLLHEQHEQGNFPLLYSRKVYLKTELGTSSPASIASQESRLFTCFRGVSCVLAVKQVNDPLALSFIDRDSSGDSSVE